MKTFQQWLKETKLEQILVGPPPRSHPDYQIWGALSDLRPRRKIKNVKPK